MTQYHYQDLIKLFNDLFEPSENTILIAGGEEPYIYLKTNPIHKIALYLHTIIIPAHYMKLHTGVLQVKNVANCVIMVTGITHIANQIMINSYLNKPSQNLKRLNGYFLLPPEFVLMLAQIILHKIMKSANHLNQPYKIKQ